MDTYKVTFETWNKVAQLYQDKFMDLDLYNDTYDNFCELIPKSNASILEIGCGPGNITRYLLNKRPALDILGIDISPNMIALAQINNPTARFLVMDSRDINRIQEKWDGIISGFCLPYLSESDVSKLIINSRDLLKSNGIIYLSFVDKDKAEAGYLSASTGDRTYFYFHTLNYLINELNSNKFEVINTYDKIYLKDDKTEESTIIIIAKLK